MSSRGDRKEGGRTARERPGRSPGAALGLDSGVSGRRFVVGACLGVLLLWGTLYLTFSTWRSSYRQRAAFGAERVAKAINPLANIVPEPGSPAVSPSAWREGVDGTRKMLETLTAANLLDVAQMTALGERIARQVSDANPATARETLAAIWDDAEASAGPVIGRRHPRPSWLRPAAAAAPAPAP